MPGSARCALRKRRHAGRPPFWVAKRVANLRKLWGIKSNAAIGRKIAVAESCTGGLVVAALTEIAGSSAVVERGFVTYSNESKQDMLGVSPDIIDTFGAVSIACAWAMAQGALQQSNADVAVAITGVAGPDGGTVQKPVGTVVFARAVRGQPPESCSAEVKIGRAHV